MADKMVCAKCKKEIKRGESSISTVKNLKKLYYHARCFGAGYLDEPAQDTNLETAKESVEKPNP